MSIPSSFRLSTFLTLAFAVGSLGYAETSLFPEVGVFAGVVLLCLAAIYWYDERAERVTLADANKLGAGIALVSTGWVAYRLLREIRLGEFSDMGWQALGMALFGVVLMLLIPAKLLRSEKHSGDWWTMHAMGLASVALAAAMASDAAVVLLITGFTICGVWSLAEFARERSAGGIPPIPAKGELLPMASPIEVQQHVHGLNVRRCLLWIGLAAALAVPLYMTTPRSASGRFEFGKPRVEIGYASDQMINLKRTGSLEENPEPAFEVLAQLPDGTPKTDLSPNQRWRGTTLNRYDSGSWSPERYRLPAANGVVAPRPTEQWEPPDLGPTTYRLTFKILTQDGSQFLADPVMWAAGQPSPAATLCSFGPLGWASAGDGSGTFIRARCGRVGSAGAPAPYVQFTRTPAEPDLGPGFELGQNSDAYLLPIVANYPPQAKEFADELLARLIREGKLPTEADGRNGRGRVRLQPPPKHHEAIARAFSNYLAESPEFTYTSDLKRNHPNADPIEEFLFDLKSGHCERFAAALAMLLRSQGIPTVLVLGFRGCESKGNGNYVVRQSDAHSWVEALISRPQTGDDARGDGRTWHWLSLDPTPTRLSEDERQDDAGNAFGRVLGKVKDAFEKYVLNYTPARREKVIGAIVGLGRSRMTWLVILAGLGIFGIVTFQRSRREATVLESEPGRWYAQLLDVLAAHGFRPQSGDTPREFATAVSGELAQRSATSELAEVPIEWAEAYYQARFGDAPLSTERRAELEARLDALASVLKT